MEGYINNEEGNTEKKVRNTQKLRKETLEKRGRKLFVKKWEEIFGKKIGRKLFIKKLEGNTQKERKGTLKK